MTRQSFLEHLSTGATTVCRCWRVRRRDGQTFGFTDHDNDLAFEGTVFRADTGLSAAALQQGTGLAVDNSEAVGALRSDALSETDIETGKFDDAEVASWLVNWDDPEDRLLQFRGSIGEIQRGTGGFRAELRGLTEALNQAQGLVYQKRCSAVLGDERCGVDLEDSAFSVDADVGEMSAGREVHLGGAESFSADWFAGGRLMVLTGQAQGLTGVIKTDKPSAGGRRIELWQALRLPLAVGDRVRLEAGCDKRPETCKGKFANFLNYRGFPHIPGEDWLMAYPSKGEPGDGGSFWA